MFRVIIHDEQVYRRLLEKAAVHGESLDAVLRQLLDQQDESVTTAEESPARKLLRLIDAADLPFDQQSFNARDANMILRREAGTSDWRDAGDDNGTA